MSPPWRPLFLERSFSLLVDAAHRDQSREWGRLKAQVEPLLTLGNGGERILTTNPDMLSFE